MSLLAKFITDIFYDNIRDIINSGCPTETIDTVYNPEYTPKWLIDVLDSPNEDDEQIMMDNGGGNCFEFVFDELESIMIEDDGHNDFMEYICASEDIGETDKDSDYWGCYNYLLGYVEVRADNVHTYISCTSDRVPQATPFIFHFPHERELPHRLQIYGRLVTQEIRSDSIVVTTYPTVDRIREMFDVQNIKRRLELIKDFLKNTDRRLVLREK